VALLVFPPAPANGQQYPSVPLANQHVYTWSAPDNTWLLQGLATGVTPGTYGTSLAVPQITVDVTGRITFAQNVAIQSADTTQVGVVQLVDDTTTNDGTKALTAAQGYKLANEIGDVTTLNPFYPNLVTAINALGAPTGVTTGTYGNGSNVGQFTINAQGRITSAVNVPLDLATTISPGVVRVGTNLTVTGTGLLSVPAATTASEGAVQLVDDTVTNDGTKALTAAAGYNLQQQIDAINIRNNLTFAGTLNATTGVIVDTTTEGLAQGFLSGSPLPAPSATNAEYFVIVTTAGTFTPPASPSYTANAGDWVVSDGTQYLLYAVGPVPATPPGLVFLDDISASFNGVTTIFALRVGGNLITPGSNLLLFVGGVPQVNGVAYNVAGNTVTFTEAPPANASFIGVTVG